jgi:hypothetical protein
LLKFLAAFKLRLGAGRAWPAGEPLVATEAALGPGRAWPAGEPLVATEAALVGHRDD